MSPEFFLTLNTAAAEVAQHRAMEVRLEVWERHPVAEEAA